jgi:nicotinate-nucleotide adenylyltransferase
MDQKKRIGIYGGTFDPVHLGHIEIAKSVLRLFEIDEILFVPALQAPHKLARGVTSALHRYAMLALATQDEPRQVISTYELEAADRRYTVETLGHFQAEFGESAELVFIMGTDSWSEITTWREWERLLLMTNHVVVTRPHFEVRTDQVPEAVRRRIVDLRGTRLPDKFSGENQPRIFITDAVMMDISATEIRCAVNQNQIALLSRLVPGAVAEYIKKYGLYRDSNEA